MVIGVARCSFFTYINLLGHSNVLQIKKELCKRKRSTKNTNRKIQVHTIVNLKYLTVLGEQKTVLFDGLRTTYFKILFRKVTLILQEMNRKMLHKRDMNFAVEIQVFFCLSSKNNTNRFYSISSVNRY